MEDRIQSIEDDQPEDGSDDLDRYMNSGNSLCLTVNADTGEDCGHTGTNVGTHNDGNCHTQGNLSGHGQALQNTNGCSRRLDDTGDQGTYEDTDQRVIEALHHLCELGKITKRRHGIGHHGHTGHENGKAKEHGSEVLVFLLLGHHEKKNSNECEDHGEVLGLKHSKEDIPIVINSGQGEDPCGKSGADVSTEDNANGLG